ncbi:MAG: T9SS type A sorting domain-containing protein [Elusimicrobia bacterium]|nr:T9SS type A sorting domain-containing protein [Elusimicrobiota bacterium]
MAAPPAVPPAPLVVFPNPFRPSQGHFDVTIVNLPADGMVRVYTMTGELVLSGRANATGIFIWDATNQEGKNVASGVYGLTVESGGSLQKTKIVVQR